MPGNEDGQGPKLTQEQEKSVRDIGDKFAARLLPDLFPPVKEATLSSGHINAAKKYHRPKIKALLDQWIEKSKDIDAVDGDGLSLLHHATAAGQTSLVIALLAKGAAVNLEDEKGMTPLIYATTQLEGKTEEAIAAIQQCFKRLIESGAVLIAGAAFPQSAMNLLASHGHLDTIRFLHEELGCDINTDAMGTPLWWANHVETPNPALINYLTSNGCVDSMGGEGSEYSDEELDSSDEEFDGPTGCRPS